MSTRVEVSPGGVGFIRTTATKPIPDAPAVLKAAIRRPWLRRGAEHPRPQPGTDPKAPKR